MNNCLEFILLVRSVQPFPGCDFIRFIYRGLPPTVIQIKPFSGFLYSSSLKGLNMNNLR
jgi:hypothetical protein